VIDLQTLLRYTADNLASDIHLKADAPPRVRIDGQLVEAPFEANSADELERLAKDILPPDRVEQFAATNDADFALSAPGVGRFRVNVFRQRGMVGFVLRLVPSVVPSLEDLGLPPVVGKLTDEQRGMVLVTGPTGSGKTTTLASMIDYINQHRAVNIITIEDPIEVLHADKLSFVNQREIGADTADHHEALRRALRQDPDVILIGEMRDPETVWAALAAAETGHLVLSTLHTPNATETVNRIVDFFPPFQQHQVRLTLASTLKGVVSQRLLPRRDGTGRVPAIEVLVMTGRIADRIVDPDANGESVEEMIAAGEWYGMQTFDQSLLSLYEQQVVTLEQAIESATRRHDFKIALEQAGLLPTG
jgi:twitching motility protein PilT